MKMKPQYTYMLSQIRKFSQAIKAIGSNEMSIKQAAKQFDLDENELKKNIDIFTQQYNDVQNDKHSFKAMLSEGRISSSIVSNLQPEFTRIDDFSKLNKTEFCKEMRVKHLSMQTMIKLIDIMLEFDILFQDTKNKDDMTEFKNMLDILR